MTQEHNSGVPENSQAKKRFGTKAKAILAGGLVLGVGAAITLAAWTDTEWATGFFSTGKFGIEGSTDGSSWMSHPDSPGATLMFSAATPTDLTPGDVVYEGYAIRLDQDSTKAADVTVTQSSTTPIAGTTADFRLTSALTCNATSFDAGTSSATFSLASLSAVQYVCMKVTAGDQAQLAKDGSGSFSWQFAATSGATL